jgi:protein SCO1/2
MAYWCWTERVTRTLFYRSLTVAALGFLLAACGSAPELPTLGGVSAFELTDQTGAVVASPLALNHKIWIADFFFTNCPGPCPRMSSQLHQVQAALANDDRLRLVSFTVDPKRDTSKVLAEYSRHFEAIPGKWFFLTGDMAVLQKLGREDFKLNDVDGSLDHSERFALVDGASRIRGYYQTTEKDAILRLIADARHLLKTAD